MTTTIWGTTDNTSATSLGDVEEVTFTFDGSGSELPAGDTNLYWTAPENRTIVGWHIVADREGSIVIDVLKKAGAIPAAVDTICGSEKPALSDAQLNSDTLLTSWDITVTEGDVFGFIIDSCVSVQRAVLVLKLR